MVELSLISKDYTPEMALASNDIVKQGVVTTNVERLDQFIINTNNNVPDKVRIIDYGIDSPLYTILEYNEDYIIMTTKHILHDEPRYNTYYGNRINKRYGQKFNRTILYYNLIQFDNNEVPIISVQLD